MVRVSTFFPLRNPLTFPAISINGQILGVRLIPTSFEFLTSGSCERERVVFRLFPQAGTRRPGWREDPTVVREETQQRALFGPLTASDCAQTPSAPHADSTSLITHLYPIGGLDARQREKYRAGAPD